MYGRCCKMKGLYSTKCMIFSHHHQLRVEGERTQLLMKTIKDLLSLNLWSSCAIINQTEVNQFWLYLTTHCKLTKHGNAIWPILEYLLYTIYIVDQYFTYMQLSQRSCACSRHYLSMIIVIIISGNSPTQYSCMSKLSLEKLSSVSMKSKTWDGNRQELYKNNNTV